MIGCGYEGRRVENVQRRVASVVFDVFFFTDLKYLGCVRLLHFQIITRTVLFDFVKFECSNICTPQG